MSRQRKSNAQKALDEAEARRRLEELAGDVDALRGRLEALYRELAASTAAPHLPRGEFAAMLEERRPFTFAGWVRRIAEAALADGHELQDLERLAADLHQAATVTPEFLEADYQQQRGHQGRVVSFPGGAPDGS